MSAGRSAPTKALLALLLLLSWTLLLSTTLPFTYAAPVGGGGDDDAARLGRAHAKRDADFWEVRTRLTKDHSGKGGDSSEKYFHESTFHPHYDGRFAAKTLPQAKQHDQLVALTRTYLSTMHAIGAETWIMHGTLLGWWWNRRIMPWDSDADVMVSERAMAFLASYYNMTVHSFDVPELPRPRKRYLLEVNPHYVNASTNDWMNVIDARWIDTENGLFIDITTLRPDLAAQERGERGMLMSKDRHRYREKDLFPLRDSYFEDTPVKVPFGYAELLEEEYGSKALVQTNYKNHQFDRERQEWLPITQNRGGGGSGSGKDGRQKGDGRGH